MRHTQRPIVCAAALGAIAFSALNSSAQCTQDWIGGAQFPGVDGAVGASLVWDRDDTGPIPPVLVVAGDFSFAGIAAAQRIAAWDGAAWTSPFGAGLNGPVRALAVYNGNLIAAGEFTQAGGTPAAGIASWDGSAWSPVGTGTDGPVYALAVFNGVLCAGGNFGHAGGAVTSGLAMWDGSAWSPIGLSGVDGTIRAMSTFNNALYVGGDFTHADATASPGIAGWDGASWFSVGGGVSPADVKSLVISAGSLYAGGAFVNAGGLAAYGVAHWNGTAWSNSGTGVYYRTCIRYSCTNHPYHIAALGTFGSLTYAFTDSVAPLTFKSSGAAWTAGGTLPAVAAEPWPVTTAQEFNGSFYLGGTFGGASAPQNIAKLNGTQWSLLNGMDGQVNALLSYAGGVVAVGAFTQADGVTLNHVGLWNGSTWQPLGTGITPAVTFAGAGVTQYVTSAAAIGNDLYLSAWPGGVLHWDGSTWSTLYGAGAFGGPPIVTTWNNQVICGAASGSFVVPEGNASSVGIWNGTGWAPLGEFSGLSSSLMPLATLNGSLYAATYLGVSRISSVTGEWGSVGASSLLGGAYALVVHGGSLHASIFASDGSAGYVQKLTGSTWHQVGGVFDTNPLALASVNGDLYAIGGFTTIDGNLFNGIARFDGTAWQPIGSGAAGSILALAGLNGNVLAGGSFTSVNGKGYSRFAIYGCVPTPPCTADFNHSGSATVQDIFDYLAAWFSGNPNADFNHVGGIGVQDIFDFLAAWFAGC